MEVEVEVGGCAEAALRVLGGIVVMQRWDVENRYAPFQVTLIVKSGSSLSVRDEGCQRRDECTEARSQIRN